MSISVVIPVFNELESLPVLIDELKINLKDFDFGKSYLSMMVQVMVQQNSFRIYVYPSQTID